MIKPLLTIAIPTFNRATYLENTLRQLKKEVSNFQIDNLEIIVSDNASPDKTEKVVADVILDGLLIKYIKNLENIGSDANIAQCFNIALGQYVLILGDDDFFIDGGLYKLFQHLSLKKYGVICLKSYGFDFDSRLEYPGKLGCDRVFQNPGAFLFGIGPLMTLISGCVINKSVLNGVDANNYCGENLVQVHLVVQAAIKSQDNLFMNRYMIACKRNNSGGYDFAKVFVENVGNILDSYIGGGLSKKDVCKIELKFIIAYFPFYLMKQRFYRTGNLDETFSRFYKRFGDRLAFYLWLYPIMKAPRWIAISWGVIATLLGRIFNGDLIRGVAFALNKLKIRGRQ